MSLMAASSSYSGLDQLLAEQNKAIINTKSQIKLLEDYVTDYAKVKTKLVDYPSKVIKKTHVPFGQKAFAPGYFQHTNEVYALLGDNYFAYVSAMQAEKIVQRRMDKLNKDIDGLKMQNKLLTDRLNFTNQINADAKEKETTEIREEYDSDAEKEWRTKHAERLRNASERSLKGPSTKVLSDEVLMQRLEELEVEEERIERLGLTSALKTSSNGSSTSKKQVRFSNRQEDNFGSDEDKSYSSEPLSDDDEEKEYSVKPASSRIIHFKHSTHAASQVQASGDSYNTPGDIFEQYLSSHRTVSEVTSRPYSDLVVERDPSITTTVISSTRPKSKFSSMRAKR